jgi:hypothetical protein
VNNRSGSTGPGLEEKLLSYPQLCLRVLVIQETKQTKGFLQLTITLKRLVRVFFFGPLVNRPIILAQLFTGTTVLKVTTFKLLNKKGGSLFKKIEELN